jgi:hypothetical protein
MKVKSRAYFGIGLFVVAGLALSAGPTGCKKKEKAESAKEEKAEKKKANKTEEPRKVEKKEPARKGVEKPAARVAPGAAGPVNVSVGIDVAKLRSTFLWKKLTGSEKFKKALQKESYQKLMKTCKIDPMKDITSVIVGVGGKLGGDKDQKWAFLIKGKFDTAKLLTCAKAGLAAEKKKAEEAKVAGKPSLSFTTKKGEKVHIIAVTKDTLAMASDGLEKAAANGTASFGSGSLAAALKRADKSGLVWGGLGTVAVPGGAMPGPLAKLKEVKSANFSVVPKAQAWNINVTVDAGADDVANQLVQFINVAKMGMAMKAAKGGSGPKAQAMALLKNLTVKTNGSKINLALPMPVAFIKKMAAEGNLSIN